ncbi:MAG TPA: PKD domain-containing protein [Thermoanaerobaculia bacterium]
MLRHTSTLLAAVTLLLLSAPSRAEHPREKPGEILAEGLSLDAGTLLLAENSGNAGKLRPEIFRRLSSAGQRAALRAAGLLPPQAARPPRAPLVGSVRPSLTPSAGQNVRVNDPSADVVGHTNNTSSVAARGGRVIVGFNDANDPPGSSYGLSADAGSTFSQQTLPAPGQNLGDPVVAFGPNGEIYYATLAFANDGASVISSCVSTDSAVSWSCTEASTVAGNVYDTQDRDWLAVDNSSSKYRGSVYVSWTDFSQVYGGSFILLARSTDGGLSFGGPQALSALDGSQVVHDSSIAIGPNGEVYVSYLDGHFGGTGITVTKSVDGGATFSTPKAAVLFTPIAGTLTGGNGVRADSFPATAVDKNGTWHLVYAAVSAGQAVDRSDIFYVRSTDGGIHFSAPVRLNDDATATSQWSPSIAVTEDGRIAVKWWDRRNDPSNDSLTDVYMTVSADGGATFSRNVRVTDHNWVFGPSALGSSHGDYDGLAGDSGTFHLSWSDERGSDPDIYYAFFPSTVAAGPDFNVSARQVYASVRGGEAATFDLATSAANGFSGPLALAVSSVSPPVSGLGYAFSSANVAAGQSSRLTVSTSAGTPPGTYLLVIAAAGPASTRRTNVRLNVQPSARAASLPLDVSRSPGFTTLAGAPRIDSAGTIHLVYDDDTLNVTGDDVFYRRSTDRGLSWSTPLKVSTNAALNSSSAASGVLALDSAGNPYVAYTSQNGSTGEIWVTRSTDRGATFQPPVRVSAAGRNADLAAIAVGANGNVVVAFLDQDPSNSLLVVNAVRSTDGGATFGAIQSFAGENNINAIQPLSLAFDSKGAAYLVWSATGTPLTCRMAVAPGGTTFTVRKTVSDTSVDAFAPRVAVDKNDAVYLTYYNRYATATGLNREVMVRKSTDGGSTFSTPVNVSNNDGQSTFPFLAVDGRGGVSVVWQDDSGNDQGDVFYAHSADGGTTFGTPVNLSATPGVSTNPSAAVDGLGNLLVMWTDDSTANTEVFSAWAPTGDSAPAVAIVPLPGGNTLEAGANVTFVANVTQLDANDPATVSWDFGDGSSGTGTPLAHTYGAPGRYVVTLKVRDALGLVSTATLVVTVRAPAFTGGPELLLPVVLDTGGTGGTHYTTELTLGSKAAVPVTVLLQYTASTGAGSGYARLTLAPGELRVVADAIGFLRANALAIPNDGSAQIGTLRVLFQGASSPSDVFVGGRTSTPGAGGTFGLFYTASQTSTTTATVFGLQQNAAQRSNLALVNAGPDPIALRVQLKGPNGEALSGPADQTLGGFGWKQFNEPLLSQAARGSALVTRVSGTGPFTAYGVLNDAVTSDGSFIPALVPGDATGADRLIPIVLSTAGYQSELTLTNFTSQPLALTLTYTGSPQLSAAGSGSVPLTLQPGEQKILPDSMAFLRNLGLPIPAGSVGGSLLVKAPNDIPASSLAAGARTFTNAVGGGTFGLFYPGLTPGESATTNASVNGLQQNGSQRSNLAIVNRGDAGDTIVLRVTYFGPDGAVLASPDTAPLAPGEWRQFNQPLASRGAGTGFAKIERLSGSSRWAAYGVLNDQHNSDGSYIPMSR